MAEIKYVFVGVFLFGILSCPPLSTFPGENRSQASTPGTSRKPVVVELFTSEGCSTCPPADALLAQFEEQQPIDGAEIIALEEHVDYWNHEGWLDPFSSSEWTLRQQQYVVNFKGDAAYTPQMILDGQSQFIGSQINEVMAEIGKESRSPKTEIVIDQHTSRENRPPQLRLSVGNLAGATEGDTAEVWLAATERGLHSQVNRGENAGKDLHHAAVVRWMHKAGVADKKKIPLSFVGNASMKLKPEWKIENLRVVAFVQEKTSRHILGAASMKIAK
jgi:hypothetical protein